MRIPGLKTTKQILRWVKNRISPGAVILGYHRIADASTDSYYNCVSPENFNEQMEIISRYANPVCISDMTSQIREGLTDPKPICVTIDDGYVDALLNAKPIFERYSIPATVFVTTGSLGGEFWWDQIERFIKTGIGHNTSLSIEVENKLYDWDISDRDASFVSDLVINIADILRPLPFENRNILVNQIKSWAGVSSNKENIETRCMTANELVSICDNNLIDLGSHTVTHPLLPGLSYNEQEFEIVESKKTLEEIISRPITGFSFPNGRYCESSLEIVHQAGYQYACMSVNGTVQKSTDPFTLPRFWVRDMGGEEFHKWLNLWL